MRRRAQRAAIAGVAAALAACTSVDEVVVAHRTKIEAALARIEGASEAMRARPPLTTNEASAQGAVLALGSRAPARSNAALVYAEDLVQPEELGNVYARIAGTSAVSECASFLKHKTLPWNPRDPSHWTDPILGSEVEDRFEECERLKWIFVMRTVELAVPSTARLEAATPAGATASPTTPPSLGGEATSTSCARLDVKCGFSGGYAKIEVHVFALDPVAPAGGFTFEVESSEKISAGTDAIESDFRDRARAALGAAIKEHAPGVEVVGL